MSKADKLQMIADEIIKDDACPELRKGATQLVFADGNPEAEIVFIGEAPGKSEDELGLPFVGAAGKFLNEMLESIGMKREDVYVTNIVKYRPPNNRDPLPEEKRAFWPYLVRQLEVIQPKIVVTLGRHSMEYFLPDLKISQCHGEPKQIHAKLGGGAGIGLMAGSDELTWVILPLYHPAAALYNGSQRQILMNDFAKIPVVLDKITMGVSVTANTNNLDE